MQEEEVRTIAETIEWLARQRMELNPAYNLAAAISCVDCDIQQLLFEILERDKYGKA